MLYKNLPKRGKARKLFLRRIVDSLAFFMFLGKGDFSNARAILKAHSDYRKMKKNVKVFEAPEGFKFPGSERKIIIDRYLKGMRR